MILLVILEIVILLNIGVLIWKINKLKDISMLGSVIPRVYLFLVNLAKLSGIETSWEHIHIGVIIIFGCDFVVNLFRVYTNRVISKITESKTVQELKNAQYKYNILANTIPIGVFTTDRKGILESCNNAFTEIIGENLIGKNIFDIICPSRRKLEKIESLDEKEMLICKDLVIETKKGKKTVDFLAIKTVNGHETITGSIREV
jgi:PAS domain S-box-containing protein